MMRLALLLAALCPAVAMAQSPPSLMFSAAEIAAVRAVLDHKAPPPGVKTTTGGGEQTPERQGLDKVFLSAVSTTPDGQWTVWANGWEISRNRQAEGFQVLAVRDDRVEILVEGPPAVRVTLRPNQTWVRQLGDVVEGRLP